MKKVFIVGAPIGYNKMFQAAGWDIAKSLLESDLVQFTGGEDVSPELYGEAKHHKTSCNPVRDNAEMVIFHKAVQLNKPIAGICRGGQFVNVMCGGSLYQDVDGHAIYGVHAVRDEDTGEEFNATSTHHQMIRPTLDGKIVCTARESKKKTHMRSTHGREITTWDSTTPDVEAVYYEENKVFGFQPHPEHQGHELLAERYFSYLNKYLGV